MNQVFAQPVGWDKNRVRPPFAPVLAYLVGTTAAGAAMGALFGAVGWFVRDTFGKLGWVYWLVAVAPLALAVLHEVSGRGHLLPERRQQVPRRWLQWPRPAATAGAWGLMLGGGVFTLLHQPVMAYAVALIATGIASPFLSALVGAVYGLTKGLILLAAWINGPNRSPSETMPVGFVDRGWRKELMTWNWLIGISVLAIAL